MVPFSLERRSRGYSLVEMLVVVAIFALMALVTLPWFFKLTQRNALKSSAREIQITLSAARMSAVKRNAQVSVVIASLTPPIQFVAVQPTPPPPTPTIADPTLILPQNAVRFNRTPNTTGGTIAFGGDGRLIMSPPPGNALTPAVMIVEGPTNSTPRNQISIEVNARGEIRVVTPVNWQ